MRAKKKRLSNIMMYIFSLIIFYYELFFFKILLKHFKICIHIQICFCKQEKNVEQLW